MQPPEIESDALLDLAESLRRRGKSLKKKGNKILTKRVVEGVNSDKRERLEIEIRPSRLNEKVCVRLLFWEDRWAWIDARASGKKGWLWEWTYDGRLLGEYSGRHIVQALEETLETTYRLTAGRTNELAKIWTHMLATGPKEVS